MPTTFGVPMLQPVSPWREADTDAEVGSSSSLSSATSDRPSPATRTMTAGLAELATLGSSPDTWSNPVISARQGSDAASWSTAIDVPGAGKSVSLSNCCFLWKMWRQNPVQALGNTHWC